jgi:spheroidene monooxygenase
VRLAYQDNWFSEYCFTRFNLLAMDGDWQGLTDMTGRIVIFRNAREEHTDCGGSHAARSAAAR